MSIYKSFLNAVKPQYLRCVRIVEEIKKDKAWKIELEDPDMGLQFEAMTAEKFEAGKFYEVRITESQKLKDTAVCSRWTESKTTPADIQKGKHGLYELVISEEDEKKMMGGHFDKKDIEMLVSLRVVPKGTPSTVIWAFIRASKTRGLDPFNKEIYLLAMPYKEKKNGVETWQTSYIMEASINGLKKKAGETGEFAGCDEVLFDGLKMWEWIAKFGEPNLKRNGDNQIIGPYPKAASVTMYRMVQGEKCAFTESASFMEYYPSKRPFKWDNSPFQMLGKVVHARDFRLGFGDAVAGVYNRAELERAQTENETFAMTGLIDQLSQCETKDDVIALKQANPEAMRDLDFVNAMQERLEVMNA